MSGCCDIGGGGFGGAGGITPPSGGVDVADEGVLISDDAFQTLDFRGVPVVATDAGGGVARITISPSVAVLNKGATISATSVFQTLNFEGDGVTAADGGASATITIPGATPNTWSYVLPEQWAESNVRRNLATHPMDCQVSTNFDTFKMLSSGSITALSTRFSQPITAGTCTIVVVVNGGATVLQVVHTAGSNPSGGIATVAAGTINYVAGDLIGMWISTNNTLTPLSSDVEAMIQVTEGG